MTDSAVPPSSVAGTDSPKPEDLPSTGRREVWSWAMYDWANSAYSTISITYLMFYLSGVVMSEKAGIKTFGIVIGVSMFITAVLSPILGAVADARGNKKWFFTVTALGGAGASLALAITSPAAPWVFVACFFLANLGFELAFGFYNGYLPEISNEATVNRVSALGFGMGYIGGGLALALAIGVYKLGASWEWDVSTRLRLGLGLMGLWWGIFSLPAVFFLGDRRAAARERAPLLTTAKQALSDTATTIANVRRFPALALFLLGFVIYNDGVQTVLGQAGAFAKEKFKMETDELGMLLLMIQFLALPGAFFVAWLSDRVGQKRTLLGCLLIWIGLLAAGWYIESRAAFWCLGGVLAIVMGGTQSVSRAIMSVMTPEKHNAEFFGFFNLSGKAASVVGPIVFTQVLTNSKNPNMALVSLIVFFVVGTAIVTRLDIERGKRDALAA